MMVMMIVAVMMVVMMAVGAGVGTERGPHGRIQHVKRRFATIIRKLPARRPGTSESPTPNPAFSTMSASQTTTTAAMTWTIATCAAMTTPRMTRASRPRK